MKKRLILVAVLALSCSQIFAAEDYNVAQINQSCDGFPQVPVSTSAGLCVGLYADKNLGFKMPRYAVQLPTGQILVTDMGGWNFNAGTIWILTENIGADGKIIVSSQNLFQSKKLTMPNGITVDPKGRVYVGTPQGVFRFHPFKENGLDLNIDPPLEVVVDEFASSIYRTNEYSSAKLYNAMSPKDKNKHPLINFVFNADFTELYVNIGAPSDNCSRGLKTLNRHGFCEQSEAQDSGAQIRKYSLDENQNVIEGQVFSRGLRNSMALAVNPNSGHLLQGENSRDYKEADRPDEELNLILKDSHYGWPYCYGNGVVAEEFAQVVSSRDCLGTTNKFSMPLLLLPPHSAPLGMLFYQSDRLPQLQNKLLMSWHGYREFGHRVVAFNVDEAGLPTANIEENIIFDWDAQANLNPLGAPVGLLELQDGSVLIIEDKNKSILRLSTGQAVNKKDLANAQIEKMQFSSASLSQMLSLKEKYFSNQCSTCHSQFQKLEVNDLLTELVLSGWIVPNDPEASRIYKKLENRQMPPAKATDQFYNELLPELKLLIQNL